MTLNWLFHFVFDSSFLQFLSFGRKISQDSFRLLLCRSFSGFTSYSLASWHHSALKSSSNNFLINIQSFRYLISFAWSRHVAWELNWRRARHKLSPHSRVDKKIFFWLNKKVFAQQTAHKFLFESLLRFFTRRNFKEQRLSKHLAFHRFDNAKIDEDLWSSSSSSIISGLAVFCKQL